MLAAVKISCHGMIIVVAQKPFYVNKLISIAVIKRNAYH